VGLKVAADCSATLPKLCWSKRDGWLGPPPGAAPEFSFTLPLPLLTVFVPGEPSFIDG